VIRRDRMIEERSSTVRAEIEAWSHRDDAVIAGDPVLLADQLRMIFTCCHPAIPPDARLALTLKLAGGFGASEIARAFLAEDTAIHQRLVRAKRRIREAAIAFEVPEEDALRERLHSVLDVLYSMFTEGHTAHAGDALLRRDVCDEAMRLGTLLLRHPMLARPEVHALLALFHLHAARFDARTSDAGDVLLLGEQDRSRWDRLHIAAGARHLASAAAGEEMTLFHLEAELAACHTLAPSWEETNWRRIVEIYDVIYARTQSPVVALNRAVAIAEIHGPAEALRAVESLGGHAAMRRYPPYPIAMGEMLRRLGRYEEARSQFTRAARTTKSEPLRRHLEERIRQCTSELAGAVETGHRRPSTG
jgi:predicted RNA polymerase sigma factor